MTPQEQQMIDGLIGRIRNTPVQNKDSEAEQHIQQGLSGTPDALYVLVQTVLVQQYGLEQAQAQINELKQQVQTLQSQQQDNKNSGGGSFLSHIFGSGSNTSSQAQTQQPAQGQTSGYQPVNNAGYGSGSYAGGYPPPPPYQPAQAYPAGGGLFGGGAGGGGFLRGALQTAAGVAAGEMFFQGMEDLFHGFGGHSYERGFGGGGGETVINNYYDEDRGNDSQRGFTDSGNRDDSGFYNPDSDASRSDFADTGDGSSAFADSGSDTELDDASGFGDDSGFDDGGSNDFSDDNS